MASFPSLTTAVSDESPTSVSAVLLISILVPAVFVLILIIALLILMAYVSGRLSKLRQNNRPHTKKRNVKHAIEEYASVKMTGQHFTDGGEGVVVAPAVPTSPCPTLNREPEKTGNNRSRGGLSQAPGPDSAYAVLEGPGHHTTAVSENERLYTPDPTINFLEAVNPMAVLSDNSERTTEGVDPTSTHQNPPLYWELEPPNNPSPAQHSEQRGERVPPPAAADASNTYWNEGMGPPGSESSTTLQNTSTSTASRSEAGEPFYLQLGAQNTE